MSWSVYLGTMVVLWGLIAVLGGAVAVYSLLAWRSQRARPLLLLGLGILLVSVVPALMWTGLYLVTDDLYATSMYCAGVMAAGFALVLASVRIRISQRRVGPDGGISPCGSSARSPMGDDPATLAYVFFHAPAPSVAPATYEGGLAAFHRSLREHPIDGYLASASYRIARAPWSAASFGPVAYADWYLVRDWGALGAINRSAVAPPHVGAHDAVAAQAEDGFGAVYALRAGGTELDRVRHERWRTKPRGIGSAPFLREVAAALGPGESVWQRQLAIGPAPEYCRRSTARPPEPDDGGLTVEVRPVATSSGR